MSSDYQPKFNRTALNVLMVASALLIVLFGQSARQMDDKPLPPAPKLDISIWQTDSGAKVWYSPFATNFLEVQLWYQAGYGYDDQIRGRASLLVQLLKLESQLQHLPITIRFDQDYIKIALRLSTEPSQMKLQIDKTVQWLQRPRLSSEVLKTLRQSNTTLSDELLQQAYNNHSYQGPKYGLTKDLQAITRAMLQKYQRSYLHPKRLHASVVGDINERSAQIIMESLLPPSKYSASNATLSIGIETTSLQHDQRLVAIWPSLSAPMDTINSNKTKSILVDQLMTAQILKDQHGDGVIFTAGKMNDTLMVQQVSQLQQVMQDDVDSDMIARIKRQLAKKWLDQVNTAHGLSQYLVQLNAYELPVNQLNKNLLSLEFWDEDRWQLVSNQLTPWLTIQ